VAAATKIASLDDLNALAGQELGASDWVTLAFEDILRFADATGDHQWIHVDRERAKSESPFGAPVAHGYYGISRIAGLFKEIVDTSACALVLNYGINRARFPNALKEGARYRLSLKLGDVKPAEETADAVFVATIEIDGQDRPGCVAEVVYRFAFA
jgi:acyl dehydratase